MFAEHKPQGTSCGWIIYNWMQSIVTKLKKLKIVKVENAVEMYDNLTWDCISEIGQWMSLKTCMQTMFIYKAWDVGEI